MAPAPSPAAKVERPRCGSCGAGIPQLNHRPFRCSYCVGDPFFGKDGYLLEMILEELEVVKAKHSLLVAHQHILAMVLRGNGPELAAWRRRSCRQYFGLAS